METKLKNISKEISQKARKRFSTSYRIWNFDCHKLSDVWIVLLSFSEVLPAKVKVSYVISYTKVWRAGRLKSNHNDAEVEVNWKLMSKIQKIIQREPARLTSGIILMFVS